MKTKPKKYRIDTFEKMLNVVNADNFVEFMYDFSEHVGIYLQICNSQRKNHPESKDKLNSELVGFKYFDWIDDGKVGIKHLLIHDPKTGEILKVVNKNKRKSLPQD